MNVCIHLGNTHAKTYRNICQSQFTSAAYPLLAVQQKDHGVSHSPLFAHIATSPFAKQFTHTIFTFISICPFGHCQEEEVHCQFRLVLGCGKKHHAFVWGWMSILIPHSQMGKGGEPGTASCCLQLITTGFIRFSQYPLLIRVSVSSAYLHMFSALISQKCLRAKCCLVHSKCFCVFAYLSIYDKLDDIGILFIQMFGPRIGKI